MEQDMMQGLWNMSHALCHMSSGYIPFVFVQVIGPSASNINSNIWQYNTPVSNMQNIFRALPLELCTYWVKTSLMNWKVFLIKYFLLPQLLDSAK